MCQLRPRVCGSCLWVLLLVDGGCRFAAADLSGARFACAEDEQCPGGTICQQGWCEEPIAGEQEAGGADARPPSDFAYRQQLTFDNRGRSELLDVPVLIALDPSRFDYAEARPDGGDIQFRDADGELLPHEIESWEPGGDSSLWVRVPSIEADSTSDHIWLLYGNPDVAASDPAPETVWSSYAAVYHLGARSDNDVKDSTAQGYHGLEMGASSAPGFIGGAHAFDGVSQYIDLGTERNFLRGVAGATLELWARPEAVGFDVMLGVSTHSDLAAGYPSRATANFTADGTVEGGARSLDEGVLTTVTTADPVALGEWIWVVVVIDFAGDRIDVFLNGELSATGSQLGLQPGTPDTSSSQATIGADEQRDRDYFTGLIDEVRIAERAQSPDWIAAQYAAMTGSLVGFAAPE